jgi:hypothetical protein
VPSSKIPDEVHRLIVEHIPSVERLEILLLLFDGRKHEWTAREVEEQIRSAPESVAQNLEALVASGLCVASTDKAKVRYQPAAEALDAAVTELALVYRTRRVAVIEMIYSERKSGVHSFSDAFKLKKPQ